MTNITLREATDKQIVDFIYDNPKDWEIECFIGPYDYDYEIIRGEEEFEVKIFDVWYVEEGECEASPLCPRDFIYTFPADMTIEVE